VSWQGSVFTEIAHGEAEIMPAMTKITAAWKLNTDAFIDSPQN
jgi:hypothetical protein